MKNHFSIGDLVSHVPSKNTGIVVDYDFRRSHQYLEREVYLNVLTNNNESLSIWDRSEEFILVQEGSRSCKA
tara:strand:- start:326 stop:541 length:216 start_codon:yes stop_codon:yes gene_type:complete